MRLAARIIRMHEPDEPEVSHDTDLTLALVGQAQLVALASELAEQDRQRRWMRPLLYGMLVTAAVFLAAGMSVGSVVLVLGAVFLVLGVGVWVTATEMGNISRLGRL
jgi:hypothetical protein